MGLASEWGSLYPRFRVRNPGCLSINVELQGIQRMTMDERQLIWVQGINIRSGHLNPESGEHRSIMMHAAKYPPVNFVYVLILVCVVCSPYLKTKQVLKHF